MNSCLFHIEVGIKKVLNLVPFYAVPGITTATLPKVLQYLVGLNMLSEELSC